MWGLTDVKSSSTRTTYFDLQTVGAHYNMQYNVEVYCQEFAHTLIPMPMPIHAYGFWVGIGAILLFMGGHGCDVIGIVT